MLANENVAEPMKGYELKIMRVFNAPRELVWKAWTDSSMAKEWMGPRGFTATQFTTPSQAGEKWHLHMEGKIPGTEQMAYLGQGGTVLEIDPPRLLKYTFAWDARESVGLGESPYKENIVTVRFEEEGNKTVMHFSQGPFATESECNGHTGGWNSAFDKFAVFMQATTPPQSIDANDVPTELHVKRLFKAPRQMVFDCWTRPEMLKEWWGPRCFTNERCEFEGKSGGNIRIDMKGPDGSVCPMEGKVIEFYPPYRFHFTASPVMADGSRPFENWNSVFFEEVEGGTMVTLDVHVMWSTEDAPKYLKGMTAGWNQSLEKLEEMLEGGKQ